MKKTKERRLEFNIKNNEGITLISLVITIAVMIIIASVTVNTSMGRFEINRYKKLINDLELLQDKVESYYLKYGGLPILRNSQNNPINPATALDFEKNKNDNSNYYVLDLSAMENISLNYGDGFENYKNDENYADPNEKDLYVINEESHTIYYVEGVSLSGKIYHYIKENENLDDNIPPTKPTINLINEEVNLVELDIIPGKDGWSGVKSIWVEIFKAEDELTPILTFEMKDIENTSIEIRNGEIKFGKDTISYTLSGSYIIKAYTVDNKDKYSSVSKEVEFNMILIDKPIITKTENVDNVEVAIEKGQNNGAGFKEIVIEIIKDGEKIDTINTSQNTYKIDIGKTGQYTNNGTYKVEAWTTDTEGKESDKASVEFVLSIIEPPKLKLVEETTKMVVQIEKTDYLGVGFKHYKIVYKKDGQENTITTTNDSIEFTESGKYSVTAYTVDNNDKESIASNTIDFSIIPVDSPKIEIISQTNDNVEVAIEKGQNNGAGFSKITVQIIKNGEVIDTINTSESSYQIVFGKDGEYSGNGTYKVKAWTVDINGKESEVSSTEDFAIFTIDPPTLRIEQKATKTVVNIEKPTNVGTGFYHYKIVYTKGSSTYNTTTTGNTIDFSENATYSVTAYTVDTNGNQSAASNTVTFTVKTLKIGDYVKYDVKYTDVYTSGTYTEKNGWRLLDYTLNSNGDMTQVKLISTGVPAVFYNYSTSETNASWWLSTTSTPTLSEFRATLNSYATGSDKYSFYSTTGNNVRASGGLYYNFEDILFAYSSSANRKYNAGAITSVTNKGVTYNSSNTAEVNGATLFRTARTDIQRVRILTLPEVNILCGNATDIDKESYYITDIATGLLILKNLSGSHDNAGAQYWLASPCPTSDLSLIFIDDEGYINRYISYPRGVRPLICLESAIGYNLQLSSDGTYWEINPK